MRTEGAHERLAELVSVCIPTRNQATFLTEAVRSAVSQGDGVPIFVSDDASEDETPQTLRKLAQETPNLQFWRQTSPLGIAGNRNFLLAHVRTPFCVMLDSDDVLEPGYCRALLPLFKEEVVGYAHADALEIDEDGKPRRLRTLRRRAGVQSSEEALRLGVPGYRVAANILVFRVEALRQVGGYDTRLRYPEDWDLSLRLADAGWANAYMPKTLARYRVRTGALRPRAQRKIDEIEGVAHIYQNTLAMAFERRGWDLAPIHRAARARAFGFSRELDLFHGEEREAMVQALLKLHDSPWFRLLLKAQVSGAGPLRRAMASLHCRSVDAAKKLLRKLQRSHG